jgi:hypothetical protein
MKHDLHTVGARIEKFDPPDLVQDGVIRVVGHVMGGNGWKRVSLESKDAPLQEDLIFFRKQIWGCWNGLLVAV